MNSHPSVQKYPEIPKEITFVWVGGPIPEKYLKTITTLAQAAQAQEAQEPFKITILTENRNHIVGPLRKLPALKNPDLSPYEEGSLVGINIALIDSLFERMSNDPFWQENGRGAKIQALIRHELSGLVNYGSASDLIRYIKLYFDGGYYLDTDTGLKKINLKADTPLHGIMTNIKLLFNINNGQAHLTGGEGNNDIIGVCPKHPVIERVIDLALERCAKLNNQPHHEHKGNAESPHAHLTGMDGKRYGDARRDQTIWATGPGALVEALKEFCAHSTPRRERDFLSVTLQNNTIAGIRVTPRSDLTWVKIKKRLKGFFASPSNAPLSSLFGGKKQSQHPEGTRVFFSSSTKGLVVPPKFSPELGLRSQVASPSASPLVSPRSTTGLALNYFSPLATPRPSVIMAPSVAKNNGMALQITVVSPGISPIPTPREAINLATGGMALTFFSAHSSPQLTPKELVLAANITKVAAEQQIHITAVSRAQSPELTPRMMQLDAEVLKQEKEEDVELRDGYYHVYYV